MGGKLDLYLSSRPLPPPPPLYLSGPSILLFWALHLAVQRPNYKRQSNPLKQKFASLYKKS